MSSAPSVGGPRSPAGPPRVAWALVAALLCAALATPVRGQPITARGAMLTIAEEVSVSAEAAGVLREVLVGEGSLVARGDRLLAVDDRHARLAEQRAKADLRRADAEAASDVLIRQAQKKRELAVSEYERAVAIDRVSPASVSDRELDRLRLSAEAATLDVERAKHDRRLAELDRERTRQAYRITRQELADRVAVAPIDGLVIQLHKQAGEWVDRGTPVATLVRVDRLRAEALLPVAAAPLDLVGRRAVFQIASGGGHPPVAAEGRVVFVSPKADPVTALARVWVHLPADGGRLRPGLRGDVRIDPAPEPQAGQTGGQP